MRTGLHNYFANGILVHNCDDGHKPQEVNSDIMREAVLDWWDGTMTSSVRDPATVVKIVVMQRLHERDLAGYCMEQGYDALILPMEYEGSDRVTSIGWSDPRQVPGELLWPERFTPSVVADLKKRLGAWRYSSQAQQRPSPAGGGKFKEWWWGFWHPANDPRPPVAVQKVNEDGTTTMTYHPSIALPEEFDEVLQSWDMTFDDTPRSDDVVGQVWAKKGAVKFLLDEVCRQMDFPATKRAVMMMTEKWPQAGTKLIEKKANGAAIISELSLDVEGMIPIEPTESKEVRAEAHTATIEAGNVYLPHPELAPWVNDFIHDHSTFPKGKRDRVDAMSQALHRLREGSEIKMWGGLRNSIWDQAWQAVG